MIFRSGIYRHYKKGDLYFAEKLVTDAQTHVQMVVYHALYPGTKTGFCEKFSYFTASVPDKKNKPVERFTLLRPVPAEKMRIFLPGQRVVHSFSIGIWHDIYCCKEKDDKPEVIFVDGEKSDIEDFLFNFKSTEA